MSKSGYLEARHCQYGMVVLWHLFRPLLPKLRQGETYESKPLMQALLGKWGALDFLIPAAGPWSRQGRRLVFVGINYFH